MSGIGLAVIRLAVYLCRSFWIWLRNLGRRNWKLTDAVVTDAPYRLEGLMLVSVEFPYSYRINGELFTGLHEEPCFYSEAEYMERFAKGRNFVVRVNPDEPEVSVVREQDQADAFEKILGK